MKKVGCVSAGVEEGLLLSEQGSWLREEGEHLVLGLPSVRGGGESGAWKGGTNVFNFYQPSACYLI